MPYPSPTSRVDLLEVSNRHRHTARLVTGLAQATPALGGLWRPIEGCLADVPVLIVEIIRLRREIRVARLARANLAAAARATLATAGRATESDPLWYLRDELAAQGLLPEPEHGATTGGRR